MLALDPNETCEVRLTTDAEAVFLCRFLTLRELRSYRRLGDDRDALAAMSMQQADDAIVEALAGVLTGWRGVHPPGGSDVPYAPERIPDVLSRPELWQLYYAVQSQSRLGTEEKKDSGSPSPANTGRSVAPDDVGPDPAPTGRA